MQDILKTVLSLNWLELIGAINGLLIAIIVVCQFIPGNQPEAFLQKIVDFIAKFSKK